MSKRVQQFVLALCIGVMPFILGGSIHAANLNVTATVHSPPPSEAPVITSHHDKQQVTTDDTVIQGTCSLDTAYVELYRNDNFAGTAVCDSGMFELSFVFTPGPNKLVATSLSSTGNPGPRSLPITIFYTPSTPPNTPVPTIPRTGSICTAHASPLILQASPSFQEVSTGERVSWLLTVPSGCAPYRVTTTWGDSIETEEEMRQRTQTIDHFFRLPGQYLITFRVVDAVGQQTLIQVVAVVKGQPAPIPEGSPSQPAPDWVVPVISFAAVGLATALVGAGWRWIWRPIKWLLQKLLG